MKSNTYLYRNFQEVVYHVIAFGLYLAASLTLLVEMNNRKRYQEYDAYLAASVIITNIHTYLYKICIFNISFVADNWTSISRSLLA